MSTAFKVFPNLYRDSVTLMQVSAALASGDGITQASAVMASESNLDLLRAAGLLDTETATSSGPFSAGDLLLALAGEDAAIAQALEAAPALLSPQATSGGSGRAALAPRSIEMALGSYPEANLALIATPGAYAAAEARKALALGLNVMMFSDNVALHDEIALKRDAATRGLLMMGPDCGTAIVDGIPLGFANVVRRGPVGVIGASGTGLQQVTCLVDRFGSGISQAIGTGGRDLKGDVGGATMLQALALLAQDPDTELIVLVSKPPAPAVAERIITAATALDRPVVVNFIGATPDARPEHGVYGARTLEEAAARAVALLGNAAAGESDMLRTARSDALHAQIGALTSSQRYLRGLFTGGTFCYESLLIASAECGPMWSNTPLDPAFELADPWVSREHTLVDLGDDAFTRGRPHPMIDPALRNERIVEEAGDTEVAVILLDLVLGYGAHPDPAAQTADAIRAARARAEADGRSIVFVASVCGTAADPQGLDAQEKLLADAGAVLADSNAAAARLAVRVALRAREDAR